MSSIGHTLTPGDENGFSSSGPEHQSGSSYGNASPAGSKSPLQMGVDFIKNFGSERKITRDGQPAKRRGPKPDSKPALTRRQELNRQAQRSHRERKEQYIKALESEISRIRENYSHDLAAYNALRMESNILKEVLTEYGIPWEEEFERRRALNSAAGLSVLGSTAASRSGSQAFPSQNILTPDTSVTSGLSPPHVNAPYMGHRGSGGSDQSGSAQPHGVFSQYTALSQPSQQTQVPPQSSSAAPPPSQFSETQQVMEAARGIFEEDPQLGIDFILSLEKPCHEHKPFLFQRSADSPDTAEGAEFSGHALMASRPPPNRLVAPQEPYPHQTYDLPHADLEKLLNLSRQLVNEGQLTPIEALAQMRSHNRYRSLTREDIRGMIEDLNRKVRCYGFGAVLEDFEVKDSLSGVLVTKVDTYAGFKEEDFMEE